MSFHVSGLGIGGMSGFCPGSSSPAPPVVLDVPIAHDEPFRAGSGSPW